MSKEREALELVVESLKWHNQHMHRKISEQAIAVAEEALAQPEQKPVAWLITDEKINSLQANSIQRLIDRAKHAYMTDIKLRINGEDEWYQADWLKHLTRTTTPQRKPLTDEQIAHATAPVFMVGEPSLTGIARAIEAAHGIKGEA